MKNFMKHLWLVLAAYGVWFAIFSGTEEILNGKYWKVVASLIFGFVIFVVTELTLFRRK